VHGNCAGQARRVSRCSNRVKRTVTRNFAGMILLRSDNADAADSTALLFAQLGGEVKVAYDGLSALALLRNFAASRVLLDIGMPALDGYQTCGRMRREKGDARRIVAVTEWGQEEDRRRAAEAGFDAHLTKPVNPVHLAGLASGRSLRA
jgi:CheY-like chemotaxis protein